MTYIHREIFFKEQLIIFLFNPNVENDEERLHETFSADLITKKYNPFRAVRFYETNNSAYDGFISLIKYDNMIDVEVPDNCVPDYYQVKFEDLSKYLILL